MDVHHGRRVGEDEARGGGEFEPEGEDGRRFIYLCGLVRVFARAAGAGPGTACDCLLYISTMISFRPANCFVIITSVNHAPPFWAKLTYLDRSRDIRTAILTRIPALPRSTRAAKRRFTNRGFISYKPLLLRYRLPCVPPTPPLRQGDRSGLTQTPLGEAVCLKPRGPFNSDAHYTCKATTHWPGPSRPPHSACLGLIGPRTQNSPASYRRLSSIGHHPIRTPIC